MADRPAANVHVVRPTKIDIKLSFRVNLDDLFGNVYNNVVTDTITPYKLCLFVLLRVVDNMQRFMREFQQAEHVRFASIMQGMIEHEDLPYYEVLRIVRYMEKTVKMGVYKEFLEFINSFRDGTDVLIRVDDLTANSTKIEKHQDLIKCKSIISHWLRKLNVEWKLMTTQQVFDLNERFREWLKEEEKPISSMDEDTEMEDLDVLIPRRITPQIPFEISSSHRARRWVGRQMHFIQVCPSACVDNPTMVGYCEMIRRRHPDIVHVNLLEMMNHVRTNNSSSATMALRRFIDYSMFRMNDTDIGTAVRMNRMGTTDQRPLRYAPLLQARLCRVFGDKETARSLLTECVQQAQTQRDVLCLRMAMIELAAIEGMPLTQRERRRMLEGKPSLSGDSSFTSKTVLRILSRVGLAEETKEGDQRSDFGDFTRIQEQLVAVSNLVAATTGVMHLEMGSHINVNLEAAMSVSSGLDPGSRGRMIVDAGQAVLTSIRIQHGLWTAARNAASVLTDSSNFPDGIADRHETEAYAIGGVNLAYSYAGEGNYEKALELVKHLKTKFNPEHCWQTAKHVLIGHCLISFDYNVLRRRYTECEALLIEMSSLAPEEAMLRRALLLGLQGHTHDAMMLLQSVHEEFDNDSSVRMYIRITLQLAAIYTATAQYDTALDLLKIAKEKSVNHQWGMMTAMVVRRMGNVHLSRGVAKDAENCYLECERELMTSGSLLERTLLAIGICKTLAAQWAEPNGWLEKGRMWAEAMGATTLHKIIVCDAAIWFNKRGDLERSDQAATAFVELDDRQPGNMDWRLF